MKIGAITGSFDPITKGHLFVITEALRLVDQLIIIIADNPAKKYTFSHDERKKLILQSINNELPKDVCNSITVDICPRILFAVDFAGICGAKTLFRGLRNSIDFEYEKSIDAINFSINPNIHTVYIIPPPSLTDVSSSVVKSFVGMDAWESIAVKYVHQHVIDALIEREMR